MKFQSRATTATLILSLLFLSLSTHIANSDDLECVYTIYVRTGSILKAGTDSKIGATVSTSKGDGIRIADLEKWAGIMGPGYNYFERGNLDIFSGRGPCLDDPICKLNLTSDGQGSYHGWYCNYLELTSTGPHINCSQQLFTVEQWLATDTSPYKLNAVVDNCNAKTDGNGALRFDGVIRSVV